MVVTKELIRRRGTTGSTFHAGSARRKRPRGGSSRPPCGSSRNAASRPPLSTRSPSRRTSPRGRSSTTSRARKRYSAISRRRGWRRPKGRSRRFYEFDYIGQRVALKSPFASEQESRAHVDRRGLGTFRRRKRERVGAAVLPAEPETTACSGVPAVRRLVCDPDPTRVREPEYPVIADGEPPEPQPQFGVRVRPRAPGEALLGIAADGRFT